MFCCIWLQALSFTGCELLHKARGATRVFLTTSTALGASFATAGVDWYARRLRDLMFPSDLGPATVVPR